MKGPLAIVPALALLAACSGGDEAASEADEAGALAQPVTKPAVQASDFPELSSKDCVDVVQFYLEALGGHEFEKAALVWGDPVIDAARLEALFGSYKEAQVTWNEPFVEGKAGSLYCTVSGKLIDAGDPDKAAIEGTLLLRRTDDIPGATAAQSRWRLQSSTFVEPLQRSDKSNAA